MPLPIEHEVIDLRYVAIHHEPQVVKNDVVVTALEVAVDVMRGVALSLNAFFQTKELFSKPLLLHVIQIG